MNLRNSLLTTALLAVIAPAAMAADTATLEIKGVIKPSPCVPAFTGNGAVIDYGDIPAQNLSQTSTTMLARKSTTLTITCGAATKIALKPVDNRAGTASSQLNGLRFGLGLADTAKIGFYQLAVTGTRDGNATTKLLSSTDNGATWTSPGFSLYADGSKISSLVATAESAPQSGTVHVYEIEATTGIARADSLPLTSDVPLDGNATIEVVYL